ncbi:MAG: hypothetical protein RBS57_09345 [Desulforhabdus sp.]|jgi:predicted DNA-binding transcriptional regulator|nr:hypothetical protein [Desulforhabdus sp.]
MQQKTDVEQLHEVMRRVGFSEETARVYGYLLLQDYASINKICTSTGLKKGQVHASVDDLLDLRVIAFDMVRYKYVLYALDPEVVWPAFANETTWRFSNTLEDYDLARVDDNLPVRHRELLVHVYESVDEIKTIASNVYRSYAAVKNHRWRDAIDTEHMAALLSETIQQADSVIRAVSSSPRLPQVALIWQSITGRMETGVEYHRIADLTELIEHGLYVVERDMDEIGVKLMVLDTSDVEHKFYIVNRSLVVVYHRTGAGGVETIGRVTNHKRIVDRYRKRFESYVEKAVPGSFVLEALRVCANRLRKKVETLEYNEIEKTWFDCLIHWGMFCKLEDPYLKDRGGLEERALRHGLIKLGTTKSPVPEYCVTMAEIKRAWRQWDVALREGKGSMEPLKEFLERELVTPAPFPLEDST